MNSINTMALQEAYGRTVAVPILVVLTIGLLPYGQSQGTALPEIICTVKPALLPAGLEFNTRSTSENPRSRTEIRAYVSSTLSGSGNVTFTRQYPTGNDYTLPEGSVHEKTDNGARILLPNFKNTTGIFTCGFESRSGRLSTSVLLHAADSDPLPLRSTVTASLGDRAQLTVSRNNLMGLAWKRTENNRIIPEGQNQDMLIIEGVTAYNGTTYETFVKKQRIEPHAVMRLIVRECPNGFWGPDERCVAECSMCYNGGVCDDKTGKCICAPGFSGNNCQNLHGSNVFGQYGQYNCSDGNTGSLTGCRGILFCQQDPYGCSCSAGYQGFDCKTECRHGYFGADCLQNCRCADNQLCAKDTGRCELSDCALGYTGNNCQENTELLIDDTAAIGYNTGQAATIRCLNFILSMSSVISLVLPNGSTVAPKSTRPITPSNNGKVAEFEVILEEKSQQFTCVVETITKNISRSVVVESFVPPQLRYPPSATLEPYTSTMIKVSWNPWEGGSDVGDGPVISYLVKYRKLNTSATFTPFFIGTANSVVIPLEPESSYEIVVVTVRPGEGGEGPPSPVAVATTLCTIPTAIPTVISKQRRRRAFSITWKLPTRDAWGCSKISTQIRYRGNGDTQFVVVPVDDASLLQNYTVSDLEPCIEYSIVLKLLNSGGYGDSTAQHTVEVGESAPGPVIDIDIDITRAPKIKLAWRPPDIGCDILEYNITQWLINRDQCNETRSETKWRKKDGTKPRTTFGNKPEKAVYMWPYSTYNISITATSEDGVGDTYYFPVITGSTHPTAPPTNITVSHVGAESLIFTWGSVPCGSRNGLINRYTSKLTDEFSGRVVRTSVGSHIRSVPYINLSSCTNYTFAISANVGEYSGPFSTPLMVATPLGLPDTVIELRAFSPRAIIIYVSWEMPNNTRCDVIYHVQYSLSISDQCLHVNEQTLMHAGWTNHTYYLLDGLEPYTTYTIYVTASSHYGDGIRAAVVVTTKQSVPGSVVNITAHSVTASNITFEWEPPPCGKQRGLITSYHYLLLLNNVTVVREVNTSSTDTRVTFVDLTGCTSYNFQVRVWNQEGNGTFGISSTVVTGVSVPNPVNELYVEPQGPHSLHVSWVPPTDRSCPVTNYVVMYSLLNIEQCQEVDPDLNRRNVSTTDVMYLLEYLEPYSTYSISVMAETEGGIGREVSIRRNTTSGVPGRARAVTPTTVTNSSLTFNWTLPQCGQRGGPITSYSYLVLTESGEEVDDNIVTSNQVTVMNLKPCNTYEILVKARNDYTNTAGTYSPKANGTTAVSKPGKVEDVVLHADVQSAILKWSPPSNFTCEITMYSIYYYLRNPHKCGKLRDVETVKAGETSRTEFLLDDLVPYSVYRVFIVGSTLAGSGQSTQEILLTMQGVPEEPRGIRVSVNIPGRLSFSWEILECMESNGIVQGYNYILLSDTEVIANYNVSDTTSSVLFLSDIIAPCTAYVFKVRGYTSAGFGDFSLELLMTTVPTVPPAVKNAVIEEFDDDPTKLFVEWNLPSTESCQITDFLVMYRVVSLDNCQDDNEFLISSSSIILTNFTDITLDELHPNTLYNVTITARTVAGEGENVSIIYRTPAAPPSVPPRVYATPPLQEGTLFFRWKPLPCDEQNGVMTGYSLALEGDDYAISDEVDLDTNDKQFDELLPCTEYKFIISGINEAGLGPYSTPVAVTTVSVPPNHVQMLRAQTIPDEPTALNITWTPPEEQICPITYIINTRLIRQLQCLSVIELQETRTSLEGTETNYIQTGLIPASLYSVNVSASSEAGTGNPRTHVASTSESAPNASPTNVTIRRELQRELTFTWDDPPCKNRNGEIVGYHFTLTDHRNVTIAGSISNKELTIHDLVPYTEFTFRVSAHNKAGTGPFSRVVYGKTTEGLPPMPQELDVVSVTRNSLEVKWLRPHPTHGTILGYKVAYWPTDTDGKDNISVVINSQQEEHFVVRYNISKLRPHTKYSVQVQARTRLGFGDWSQPIIIARTDEGVPSAPVDVQVEERSQSRLRVSWKEPEEPNGKIISYNVMYKAIEKAFDPSFIPGDEITLVMSHTYITLNKLDPATKYEIGLSAATVVGSGPITIIQDFTRPPTPIPPLKPQHMPSESDLEVHLQLAPVKGDFSAYHVWVRRTPNPANVYRRSANKPSSFTDNSDNYVAAEFTKDNLLRNFTVGDNKTYGGYFNAPLVLGHQYSISFCTVTQTTKDTESSCSESIDVSPITSSQPSPPQSIPFDIVAIAVAILFVLVITFIILAVIRKRRVSRSVKVSEEVGMSKLDTATPKTNGVDKASPIQRSTGAIRNKPRISTKPTSPNKGWRPPTPIAVPNLPKYIKQRKADGEKGFTRDYDSMPAGQTCPWNVANIPENKVKNRYANIIAYDHSRVVLVPYDDVPYSDYINANYIDGYRATNKYIASQGPNLASTVDFWRMLWQERVPKVIMLTNVVENGKKKCAKYWPTGVKRYGELLVCMAEENVNDYYTERTFKMEDDYIGEQREVKQFHFTAWPDMGLPESPTPLIAFVQTTKQYQDVSLTGPTVVHCSAGVGRTGTFLAIDVMLDMAVQDRKINVLDYVYRMRQRRIKMVQTQDQYMFIFEVLLEALLCGDTVFSSSEYPNRYSDLKQTNPLTDKPYLNEQLRALDVMSVIPNEENARGGRIPDNMDKNRYQHLIPIDKYRPYLMTQWKERTNYINATFLDTYKKRDAMLATQMPLHTTVIDFWRMMYDYRSNIIVMLNRMDPDDSSCAQYWPDGGSLEYGPFDVELMSAEECGDTIIRTFKLKHIHNKIDSRIVHQYQYLGWPEKQTFPASPSSLIALVKLVANGQRSAGDEPTTVHCMDGVTRSGLFCAISMTLARLTTNDDVDVFHAVKKLRKARAGMVCTLEHYLYCYNTILAYLESNQTYMNYK